MNTITRDSFLGRTAIKSTSTVELGDGTVVRFQKLSQADVEQCRRAYVKDDKAAEGYRFVLVQALVDEEGKRLLQDADMAALASMDFDVVETIATAILRFSGVQKDVEKKPEPSAE